MLKRSNDKKDATAIATKKELTFPKSVEVWLGSKILRTMILKNGLNDRNWFENLESEHTVWFKWISQFAVGILLLHHYESDLDYLSDLYSLVIGLYKSERWAKKLKN